MKKTIKIKTNLWSGIVFSLISVLGLIIMPSQILMPKYDIGALNPRILPTIMLVAMLLISLFLIAQSLIFKKEKIFEFEWKTERTIILLILLMCLFSIFIISLGYLPAILVIISLLLYLMGERKPLVYIITLAIGFGIYFLFQKVFNIPLPVSFFFR